MASSYQAMKWLLEGRKIYRTSWIATKCVYFEGEVFKREMRDGSDNPGFTFDISENDWEIYTESCQSTIKSIQDRLAKLEGVMHDLVLKAFR